ncbi:MAG TPA: dihydrolipoamide acetyltransferase family protein [bacterium]|jgi:pyruvate dehydrogenase E2 component (dihydrolipoamide acetyltransferase)
MAFVFKFPDIGEGIHEGKILEWRVARGQMINEGDPLVKVETDKVVADIPSPRTGMIKTLFGKVGQVINVGDVLAELDAQGEEASAEEVAAAPTKKEELKEAGYGVVGEIEVAKTDAFLPATGEGFEENGGGTTTVERRHVLASPVARRMAKDLGVDLRAVQGSGPAGRVMKEDIERASQRRTPASAPSAPAPRPAAPAPAPRPEYAEREEFEDLTQIRKTIAARMAQSKYTAPHFTAFDDVEVSRLVEIRREQKDVLAQQGITLSYLPFIVRAAAVALREHRKLNCRLDLDNNRVVYHNYVNIGMAVDTPDGLIVPVIKDADKKSILELAMIIQDLGTRARERKLALSEIREGTFSITNFGSLAGRYGTPIINYPEVAILGIGRIQEQPVVRNGQIVPGQMLPLSLSADHRIVDGGDVARFLKDLMAFLSDPVNLLLR